MKTRIIGTILVLLILGALFVATESEKSGTITPAATSIGSKDAAFKNLTIN